MEDLAAKAVKVVVVVAVKVRRESMIEGKIVNERCIGGRGRGRGRRGQRPKEDAGKSWVPVTKLGRLVNDGKIHTVEEIYLFSLPIKVSPIFRFTQLFSRKFV